jgi:hypothetical protein
MRLREMRNMRLTDRHLPWVAFLVAAAVTLALMAPISGSASNRNPRGADAWQLQTSADPSR